MHTLRIMRVVGKRRPQWGSGIVPARRSTAGRSIASWMACVAALLLGGASGLCETGTSPLAGQRLKDPILVVQFPGRTHSPAASTSAPSPLRSSEADRGRIVLVSPDGAARVLTRAFYSACEPDVSFDGKQFVFAGKPNRDDRWNIYEMSIEGGPVRQITRDLGDCRSPGYQSRHYQISESNDTWFQITFVRSDPSQRAEQGTGAASSLWTCKLDGSLARPITFNLANDFDPSLMWDGRLLFASWRPSDREGGGDRVSLLEINADGTDYSPFVGNVGKRIKQMPCTTPRQLAVFVESDSPQSDGAGTLGCVSLLRPQHTYRKLTEPVEGLYHSPSPLPDGSLLVSRRPTDGSAGFAVYRYDVQASKATLVFDDAEFDDVQARAVVARREPDGRSSSILDTDPLGKLYCMNVYNNDPRDGIALPEGSVKRLRIVEGLSASASSRAGESGSAGSPSSVLRRVIGECDVPGDGSFNVQLPANIPVELQLLDDRGMTLRRCGWVWTRNHFNQGCVGCHEDPEITPDNVATTALNQLSVVMNPADPDKKSVTFLKDILPIVESKCLPCHAEKGSPPVLPPTAQREALYRSLVGAGAAGGGGYVHPGQSRTSPLIWHVLGQNSSRPWDGDFASKPAKPIPADSKIQFTASEQALLIQWIDLGASYGPAEPASSSARSP